MDPPLEQFLESQPVVSRRTVMPKPAEEPPKPPSLLSMVKDVIGKDLSAPLPPPIAFCEPSVELMKRAEDIEYSELLDEAAELPKGSLQRLLKVAAYALSPYSACHANRVGKPMLSGPSETLEAVYPEKGLRYLAESIQDGAWVVATIMEGRKWTLATDDQYKTKMWGPSMDFIPNWFLELTFNDGEVFTWRKGLTSVNNLVSGDMYVTHRGQLKITQKSADRVATIKFKEPSMTTLSAKSRKAANRPVTGYIEERGQKLASPKLSGFWDSNLDVTFEGKKPQTLWTANPIPAKNNLHRLPTFMMGLTDRPAAVQPYLPPTDARKRQDTHLLENGHYEKARDSKDVAEQAMHKRIALASRGGRSFIQPKWFAAVPNADSIKEGDGIRWRYTGRYWAARANGFVNEGLPNLY